jgi:hypothetical protein
VLVSHDSRERVAHIKGAYISELHVDMLLFLQMHSGTQGHASFIFCDDSLLAFRMCCDPNSHALKTEERRGPLLKSNPFRFCFETSHFEYENVILYHNIFH